MSKRSGLTLIELLVASIVVGILTMALSSAFASGLSYPNRASASRERELARVRFEDRIRELLANATVTSEANDTASYFVAGAEAAGEENRLTFTTASSTIPGAVAASTDTFEDQNQRYGPQGGLKEVSIGLTPVGQTNQTTGVFVREQRPSDGDNTQGGFEEQLDAAVNNIQFEFYDGTTWLTDWDTALYSRRIPAAVRVTYQLEEEDQPRVMVVRLLKSDVTAENPATQTSTAGGTGQ